MNLIEQFMKMGGFKTPQELEAYGEENFFRDFPEAKKLAMGGTPEAFPQIATADQFFSYGVPVPPTYHRDGGATGLPNIYSQIQSEQQFFSPVYTNSNNAYEVGGSYQEAFPQAVSFPNKGWGKTNYFMLQSGGTFPPGMSQFTGMLPVMQSGSELAGIDSRAQADMNHYYGTPYPMMTGGQPSLQAGGQPTGTGKDSFYTDKMQNFISKVQNNGQKALLKSIETVDEMPPMTGMRTGGLMRFQGNDWASSVPGAIMLDPNKPGYEQALADYKDNYLMGDEPKKAVEIPAPAPAKKAAGTSGGVSTSVAPGSKSATAPTARTQAELEAEIKAEKEKEGTSGPTAAGTTGTSGSSSAPAATGPTNSATTTTNTTGTTPTGFEGWRVVPLNDGSGRSVVVDNNNRAYFDASYTFDPRYYQYPQGYTQPQQQRANYGNLLDYIPGGGLRRKSANLLLATALAGNDLSQYEVDPRSIVTRRAILPGNRIKSFDLVKKGTKSDPYKMSMPTEPAKTTQVPTIQDPNTFQSAMPAMTTKEKVKTAFDSNFKTAPVIGSEGPVKQPSMMAADMRHGGPYALPMFQSDILSGEVPPFDGAVTVNAEANNTQNMYWDTGVNDVMAEQARQITKDADPFKTEDDRLKMDIKRKGPFADLSADQMIAGMDTLAGFFNKYGSWNQEDTDFNTALQVYGVSNAPNSRGSYVMNQPAVGLGFRPNQANANMRGMYAQYGGQPFYYADTYYLTMPTIKNVKKAGAYKFGK